MSQSVNLKTNVIPQRNPRNSATILFLHGAGNTGVGLISQLQHAWGEDISFPHIKMIFPTAQPRPYTLYGGQITSVWFDRDKLNPTRYDHESMDEMCHTLSSIIDQEVRNGIPKNRIIIGGYSQGGALALKLGYKYQRDVAGVFALSGFLNHKSNVYEALKQVPATENLPPLFQCHGSRDEVVRLEWGHDTFKRLKSNRVKGEFHEFDIEHQLIYREIGLLREWILELLPDYPKEGSSKL